MLTFNRSPHPLHWLGTVTREGGGLTTKSIIEWSNDRLYYIKFRDCYKYVVVTPLHIFQMCNCLKSV